MKKPKREISPSPASPPAAARHPLPPGEREKKVRVARIGAAHGIRGEVRLWSFTEDPMAVANYGPLETEDGVRWFEIETARQAKDFLVARIAGIANREAAEKLRNTELFVPRDRLPPIEDVDTFYHADLVGLAAVDESGGALGTVMAVHNFGAGDLIEIAPAAGGEPLLLPFTEATVPEVDLEAGRIVVVPPAITAIPPLKGEGRPPKRSKGGRGGVKSGRDK